MYNVDYALISTIILNKNLKHEKCTLCPDLIKQYQGSNSNLSNFIINSLSQYELAKYIKSNENYIKIKDKRVSFHYKPKDMVYADLGSNVTGEYSYERLCVVIKSGNEKIFIVPCSTSKNAHDKQGNLYPDYLIGKTADGFPQDSVILLKDARWISKARVLKKSPNKIAPEVFSDIYNKLFAGIFTNKYDELELKKKEIETLKGQITRLEQEKYVVSLDLQKANDELKEYNLLLEHVTSPD